jgi:T5SS/PEP-CTERM-associated repeat protein
VGNAGFVTVTVDGMGSNWTNSDSLFVGGTSFVAGATSVLNAKNGGVVDGANTLRVGNTGTVNLTGGTINNRCINRNTACAWQTNSRCA